LYTREHDSYKPHASGGKIGTYKTCSFASEKSNKIQLDCAAIKQITEETILMRCLQSNDSDQQNYLTQFIDMNPIPKFDNIDTAIFERIAVVNINNSYFTDINRHRLTRILAATNRKIVNRNKIFEKELHKGKYNLALFYILENWIQKYHMDTINLENTPDYFIESETNSIVSVVPSEYVEEEDLLPESSWKYIQLPTNTTGNNYKLFYIVNADKNEYSPIVYIKHVNPNSKCKIIDKLNNDPKNLN